MTDKEIVQALRCCADYSCSAKCPAFPAGLDCREEMHKPEGWWENRQFNPDDVYNNPVDCTVTHWMPLPGAPERGGSNA